MGKKIFILCFLLLGFINLKCIAQEIYSVTSGEMIFSQNNATFSSTFLSKYPGASIASSNVRFTAVIQVGQYMHFDLTDNIGLYSGLALRNIGMITNETLPQTVNSTLYKNFKLIRRKYTLGIPLALKLGSFSKNFYLFGGGEFEMAFLFKEKYWSDSMDRSGVKTKTTTWFGGQTPTFMPSLFAGIQLPKGLNLKFKYYLDNFFNSSYSKSQNPGATYNVSDLSRYGDSRIVYFSLCWQMKTSSLLHQ
jgi:hypothetical protein